MVETSEVDGVERHRKSIPDPLERGGIAPATRGIAGCRVDLELTRPELKTGALDLSGGLVAKLEVECRLGDVDRSGRRALLTAGLDRPGKRLEGTAHLSGESRRHLSRPIALPGGA